MGFDLRETLTKTRAEKREASLRAAYAQVFNTIDGKVVLEDLFKYCGMDTTSFVPGCPDESHHNEGMRRGGLYVQTKMNISSTEAFKIVNEARMKAQDDQVRDFDEGFE